MPTLTWCLFSWFCLRDIQRAWYLALLLSRGWRDKTVLVANLLTALATLAAAVAVYLVGSSSQLAVGPLLALTAGFFIYVVASDIIPDIHEQPRRVGTIQALMLVVGIVIIGTAI